MVSLTEMQIEAAKPGEKRYAMRDEHSLYELRTGTLNPSTQS